MEKRSYLDDNPNANIVINRNNYGYIIVLLHYILEDRLTLKRYSSYINSHESVPYEIEEKQIPLDYNKGSMFDIHLSYNWPGIPFKCIR